MLGAGRYSLESRNKAVELTLDYAEVQSLSASSGTPIPELLKRFKAAGITGIAITENTLGDLASIGRVRYQQLSGKQDFLYSGEYSGQRTAIYFEESASDRLLSNSLFDREHGTIISRLAPDMATVIRPKYNPDSHDWMDSAPRIEVITTPAVLNTIGIGLPGDAVYMVREAGLDIVARLDNNPTITKRGIDASLSELKNQGIQRVIFSGEEVLGFRGLVPYAAEKIKALGLTYGSIEFGKQKGDARLSKELDSEFVRVHSIPIAEMATMMPSSAVERFERAVKERGIRLCYIRLMEISGENPVEDSAGFVASISQQIRQAGYTPGIAHTYGKTLQPLPLLLLIGLSIVAGTVLLLESMFSLSTLARFGLLAIGFILSAGLIMKGGNTGIQGLALLSALVFPTLGVTMLTGPYFHGYVGDKRSVFKVVGIFIGISAITLCGALMIVGLLADRSYMVKLNQFSGIKAAHMLPLLVVAFVMASGLPVLGKPFSQVRKEVSGNLRRLVNNPLFVWHVIAVFSAMIIVGFAMLRTGNDPGMGVSGLELKFRAILDQVMMVRPRTKEFLIGHPALFMGIGLLLTRRRAWGLPLLAFGMLGQVSLLNTFCHIHTPLYISILRAANGLILGLLIGLVVWRLFGQTRNSNPSNKV